MGSKSLNNALNPLKQAKNAVNIGKAGLQGKLGKATKLSMRGDIGLQATKAAYRVEKDHAMRTLKSETGTAIAAGVATYFGGPVAGTAVASAGQAVQQREAGKKAKAAQRVFDKQNQALIDSIDNVGDSLGESAEGPQVAFRSSLDERRRRTGARASILTRGRNTANSLTSSTGISPLG